MTDIDIKAKALSNARTRILQLQEQMTHRVLQMASEVEKLMEVVEAPEARAFLKARCNLPATELSTYVGFAKTLKASEGILRKARASFPVMRSLVAADVEVRQEVLERMEIGAHIDTKDVAAIRRRLAIAKLTVPEAVAARDRKLVSAAARKQTNAAVAFFERQMCSFVDDVRKLPSYGKGIPSILGKRAAALLSEFETLFGSEHRSPRELEKGTPAYGVGRAYHALKGFRDDSFDKRPHSETNPSATGMRAFQGLHALQATTGRPWMSLDLGALPTGLTELPPNRHRLNVLEICAGAGGMALGLERAGFRAVGLIELNGQAVATLRKNRPTWPVIEADIRDVDFTPYQGKVDLLAGGVPCTPFSTSGERKGKTDKNDLFPEAIRAVKEVKPRAFIFENVEGLLHASHADHVAGILRQFSKAGYETFIERINTRDYGLAQNRSRILVIGIRKELSGSFRMPPKFLGIAPDMGTVLGDLMGENGWSGSKDWAQRMSAMPVVDKSGNLIRTGILADTIRGYKGSGHVKEKSRWLRNGVAYAPIAKAAPTDEEAKTQGFVPRLTNRMRAVLQGFPDDWEFVGGIPAVANQIGNAVAPVIAQAVGLAMFTALRGFGFDWKAMLGGNNDGRVVIEPPPIAFQNGSGSVSTLASA